MGSVLQRAAPDEANIDPANQKTGEHAELLHQDSRGTLELLRRQKAKELIRDR